MTMFLNLVTSLKLCFPRKPIFSFFMQTTWGYCLVPLSPDYDARYVPVSSMQEPSGRKLLFTISFFMRTTQNSCITVTFVTPISLLVFTRETGTFKQKTTIQIFILTQNSCLFIPLAVTFVTSHKWCLPGKPEPNHGCR